MTDVHELDSIINAASGPRLLDVVRRACSDAHDVRLAVSFTRFSGLGLILDSLKDVVDRKGEVRILTSTYQCVTQPDALRALSLIEGIDTRVQDGPVGFHTKFWWFSGEHLSEFWAGSSNLSKGGLSSNIEWNLRTKARHTVDVARQQFDELWNRTDVHPITEEFIDEYESKYNEHSRPLYSLPIPSLDSENARLQPNAAQREALKSLNELRSRGETRAAVIAATGIGKTLLAAFDAKAAGAKTLLFVSHRLEHLEQALTAFLTIFPRTSMGILGGGRDPDGADFVFASIASLSNRTDFLKRQFDYLVIDEFHHAEAPSYQVLSSIRDRAFLLGLTATPERQDGHDVLRWCDWNIAYEVRLPAAIENKWLLPFHYYGLSDDTIEYRDFPWRNLSQIENVLSIEDRAKHVLRHAIERGYDGNKRRTVGFCAGVQHAKFMASAFQSFGETAAAITGEMTLDARKSLYRRFEDPRDRLSWIFVSDLLNEGVDIPSINSLLFLRPTESPTLFLQQLGRGLRLFPETEVLTVLDFVGHHQSAWLSLNAIDSPLGSSRVIQVGNNHRVHVPLDCEVVLQPRTKEILERVTRYASRPEACKAAYTRIRAELGRPLLPIDLWNRNDAPPLREFLSSFGTWVDCQRAASDEPSWLEADLANGSLAQKFLRAVEKNWQAQRVHPYALVLGLCYRHTDAERGYEEFFRVWPQWAAEYSPLKRTSAWSTVSRKLSGSINNGAIDSTILKVLGDSLKQEVEGRIFYTANMDYQSRHGGVLRSPEQLRLYSRYSRPEVIRYFGAHYDPTRHNKGIMWFGNDAALIMKLDNRGAVRQHRYNNEIIDARTIRWTSQNNMSDTNPQGIRVLSHKEFARRLFIFVQRKSHDLATYLGQSDGIVGYIESNPMSITIRLSTTIPEDVLAEFG